MEPGELHSASHLACLTFCRLRIVGWPAGSTLNHWPFPISNLPEGYAYLLTHPGTPCVFWDHWLAPGLGDSINKLLKCRQQHSLHCRSKVGHCLATSAHCLAHRKHPENSSHTAIPCSVLLQNASMPACQLVDRGKQHCLIDVEAIHEL